MIILRLIFIGVLFTIPLQASAQDEEYNSWVNMALNELNSGSDAFAYRDWSSSTRTLATRRLNDLEPYIDAYSSDPIIWYIRGEITNRFIYFRIADVRNSGGVPSPNDSVYQSLVKEYQSYYRKALELDDNPDAPEHLTAEMLTTMADDVLAASDIKERAYKKAIALAQSGKANVPETTYQFLLESYSAQKSSEKYLATLNEMIDRFGSNEELEGYKRHVEEVIEKQKQTATQDAYAQTDIYTQPKLRQFVEPKKVGAPKAADEVPTSDNNAML